MQEQGLEQSVEPPSVGDQRKIRRDGIQAQGLAGKKAVNMLKCGKGLVNGDGGLRGLGEGTGDEGA